MSIWGIPHFQANPNSDAITLWDGHGNPKQSGRFAAPRNRIRIHSFCIRSRSVSGLGLAPKRRVTSAQWSRCAGTGVRVIMSKSYSASFVRYHKASWSDSKPNKTPWLLANFHRSESNSDVFQSTQPPQFGCLEHVWPPNKQKQCVDTENYPRANCHIDVENPWVSPGRLLKWLMFPIYLSAP